MAWLSWGRLKGWYQDFWESQKAENRALERGSVHRKDLREKRTGRGAIAPQGLWKLQGCSFKGDGMGTGEAGGIH